MISKNAPPIKRPLLILLTGTIAFCLMGLKDSVWTYAFWRHPWPDFTNVMARSMFEGELPGVSDLAVMIPIVAFFIWLKRRRDPALKNYSQKLKFLFLSGLMSSLLTIQALKWIISRARPKVFESEVLEHLNVDPSSIWLPGYMGWDGPRGYSWNSFPSGHTGTCAVLLALIYLVPDKNLRLRFVLTSLILSLTIAMGISRSMAGMHWLSDSVASLFIVWAVIDYLAQLLLPKRATAF